MLFPTEPERIDNLLDQWRNEEKEELLMHQEDIPFYTQKRFLQLKKQYLQQKKAALIIEKAYILYKSYWNSKFNYEKWLEKLEEEWHTTLEQLDPGQVYHIRV